MGPVNMKWYRDRGLTQTETHIAEYDSMFYNVGEPYTVTTITEQYSAGRIDITGIPDEPFGDDFSVPPMRAVDWARLGLWLDNVRTCSVWSLEDIVTAYNFWSGHEPIQWDTYEPTN
jgi:hypothetical protein